MEPHDWLNYVFRSLVLRDFPIELYWGFLKCLLNKMSLLKPNQTAEQDLRDKLEVQYDCRWAVTFQQSYVVSGVTNSRTILSFRYKDGLIYFNQSHIWFYTPWKWSDIMSLCVTFLFYVQCAAAVWARRRKRELISVRRFFYLAYMCACCKGKADYLLQHHL